MFGLVWFGLVWFYGPSTIIGYLMPNPVFTYILDIRFVKTFGRYIELNDQTVLLQTIQFGMSQQSLILPNIPMYHHQFN